MAAPARYTAVLTVAGLMHALLQSKSARLADVQRDPPGDLLVRSDLSGTMQLYELAPGEELTQLTALPEPVGRARYVPGGDGVVIEVDHGGDERFQLYSFGRDAARDRPVAQLGELTALTEDSAHVHLLAGVSPDGRRLAYLSNRANGVDFDLWSRELSTGGERRLYADGGWCQPGSGFSPDGTWVSVLRPGPRPLDMDLLLVNVETCETRVVLPHAGEAALVGAPAWLGDDEFLVSSNVGRDNAIALRHDFSSGRTEPVPRAEGRWDASVLSSPEGGVACFVENRNGASRVTIRAPGQDGELEVPLVEPGIVERHDVAPPQFSTDGSRLYYTLMTPRRTGDVWAFDRRTGKVARLTNSPVSVAPEQLVSPELAEVVSFDGEPVPLFVFRPSAKGPRPPVVVLVHGGPEGQATLAFDPVVQGLVSAGYGVVVPNVRGSAGYGKRYASLDDTTKRLDSVRDLASVHGRLEGLGFDQGRAALWGGSYGGYMVLAGLAFQPELWAAGVDIVGISDLVTFLENTSPYRRAHREREYGSLAKDRDFLVAASPLRRADAIRAPLFVVHGRNDPRVPVSEAEQLVAKLTERDIRCELVIYEDEGHGLARLSNRLDAFPRALTFLDEVLQHRGAGAPLSP
ncbi:MAG TPA: alpha/beta fold hydrolase [Acidimicrobiales bacterium]|nr:alpha/beta fold hydrolase [Acidimicrobiales bacterium]